MQLVNARPILYYRPASPHGSPYLHVSLKPGGNTKKAGNLLHVGTHAYVQIE